MSFWNTLKKPLVVMAPMADVTDPAFRKLVGKYGAPDVFWTEFVSADGLYHTREVQRLPDAENPLMRDLIKSPEEKPIVAQLFSSDPKTIAYATKLAAELGFDGVDLNMGCPDRSIERQGAGAAMIKSPEVAREVIRAAKAASSLPISVKTRLGYHKETLEEWLPVLLQEDPAAITLHLRTRKEMSKVDAHWDLMRKAVEIRNAIRPQVLLLGNGDVKDKEDARKKIQETGCDGAMIGRGMFGNPWVFTGRKHADISIQESLAALVELAQGFEALMPRKSFNILKKHIKAFVTGFDGAAELRGKLMAAENSEELERVIQENPL